MFNSTGMNSSGVANAGWMGKMLAQAIVENNPKLIPKEFQPDRWPVNKEVDDDVLLETQRMAGAKYMTRVNFNFLNSNL